MTNILIINQHGSNRGDEAACRGMLSGLRHFIPDAKFTLFTVYPLQLDGIPDVTIIENLFLRNLRTRTYLSRMLRYLALFYSGYGGTPTEQAMMKSLHSADLIISAPGGPYIGDLYPWTELELLFHLLLATLTSSPVMIYAPSMGPFENNAANRWRKRILRRVDLITVREAISATNLLKLGITLPEEFITADSALQSPVDDALADQVFSQLGLESGKKYIGFIPLELGRFKDDEKKIQYIELLSNVLRQLSSRFGADLLFFPQGYAAWLDRPMIEALVSIAGIQDKSHIVSEQYNSNEQQALVGKMSAFVSFRYHPGIFAFRQSVPCVVVAYEHKVRGFMKQIGMEDFCLDLETVTTADIVSKVGEAWQEQDAIRKRVQPKIKVLEQASLKNSALASWLLEYQSTPSDNDLNSYIHDRLLRYESEVNKKPAST